jgi:hypothetical protein
VEPGGGGGRGTHSRLHLGEWKGQLGTLGAAGGREACEYGGDRELTFCLYITWHRLHLGRERERREAWIVKSEGLSSKNAAHLY